MPREIPPTSGLRLTIMILIKAFAIFLYVIFSKKIFNFSWKNSDSNKNSLLENKLQKILNLPNEILITNSGTAALIIALKTLSKLYPAQNLVILPAYSCPLLLFAFAIHLPNLKILLCDTKKDSFNFDFLHLQLLIKSEEYKHKILAVVPTHLGGEILNLKQLKTLLNNINNNKRNNKNKIFIIEDAAQSLGGKDFAGNSVGLQGDIGFFSLAVGKGLTMFEGGVLFSKNKKLTELLKIENAKIQFSWRWNLQRIIELLAYFVVYRPSLLYYFHGKNIIKSLQKNDLIAACADDFDETSVPLHKVDLLRKIIAFVACDNLKLYWENNINKAKINKNLLLTNLRVNTKIINTKNNNTYPFLILLCENESIRNKIFYTLAMQNLGVSILFANSLNNYKNDENYEKLYQQNLIINLNNIKYNNNNFENANNFAKRVLIITNSEFLSENNLNLIIQNINKIKYN